MSIVENSFIKSINKSIKNRANTAQNLSWRALGRVLETVAPNFLGNLLVPSWEPLVAVLALSWGHLELFWFSIWNQDGYKSIEKMIHLGIEFGKDLRESKMGPSWYENDVQDRSYLGKADKPETLMKPIEF